MTSRTLRILPLLAAMAVFLAGCSDGSMNFPVTEQAQKTLTDQVQIVRITPQTIHGLSHHKDAALNSTSLPPHRPGEYRIGPSDVISIFVFDHPELAIPTANDQVTTGYLVNSDGTLTFPFIGSVLAKGKTVDELRAELSQRLANFFPDPQVDVRIADFNSQRVVIGGAVETPTTAFIGTTPLTLLEAINAAGGLTDDADPRAITVRRGGQGYRVDLDAFLIGGMGRNNPTLRADDVVSVPRRTLREAYVLGEVVEPATIDLSKDAVTLTQSLARQGGLDELRADARGIFVFRYLGEQMTVYQLDTSLPTALLLGTKFALWPGDVIYVTKSPLQRWNDTISRILPSVTAAETVRDF